MPLIFVSPTTACAVKSNGKMVCWGNGANDRLGFGNSLNQQSPVEVKNINTAVSCSLGHDHSCVKLSDKTNRCWGSANSGQLGNGQLDSNKMTIPVTVNGINTATQISVGTGICAVLKEEPYLAGEWSSRSGWYWSVGQE